MYDLSLFIFRRDLRVADNTGLIQALEKSKLVLPLFIFTPTQISSENKYKSSNAIQFMIESLGDLTLQIKKLNPKSGLVVAYGDEITVLQKLHKMVKFEAIFINADYTPYARKRDLRIENFCQENEISFNTHTDILLLDRNDIYTANGNPYHIFTQFYNKTIKLPIRKPEYSKNKNFMKMPLKLKKYNLDNYNKKFLSNGFYQINDNLAVHGGRQNGLRILKIAAIFRRYSKTRNIMSMDSTKLSAHNKFGTVSVREVYLAFKNLARSSDLCKQLYWRDFYYYVGIHFKGLYKHDHLINPKSSVKWVFNRKYFDAWTNGLTGFPIVDAAMRELNTTGFMHNRGRLIVSSFLVKDLLINWKYGEKYFSQKLVDIDRAQNVGNWNWSSSFGLDSTPFLRILNPWSQSAQYDSDALYIKKWVPELADIPASDLHIWYKSHTKYPRVSYPKPIIDHASQRKKFISFYQRYFKTKKN